MFKMLLLIFCCSSFTVLSYTAAYDTKDGLDQKVYDLNELLTRRIREFGNAKLLKELKTLDNLRFGGVNEDYLELLSSEIQLLNSSKCIQDLLYTLKNIKSDWGFKFFDSYGKPESGIRLGNFHWIGDYDECVGIRATNPNSSTIGNFKGKYCSLTWSLDFLNSSLPLTFVSGICLPDSCSAEELRFDVLQLLNISGAIFNVSGDHNFTLNPNPLQCKPTERHLNVAGKAIIALLSVFCALAVLGSSVTAVKYFKNIIKESRDTSYAADIYENKQDPDKIADNSGVPDDEALLKDVETAEKTDPILQKLETFLVCFCVFTNGAKLLNTTSSEGELLCIHGIRFLSMSWVILGHTYIFGYAQMRNMLDILSIVDNFPFQAILQAVFSVDSFFVLSGFLLTFLSMKEFSRTKGKISWAYFYIHRYLRLTPMYMIILGFSATVYLYLGSGPYWPDLDYDIYCRKDWWKNLLYINNFGPEAGACMGWSWYLANDMQFFVISPLFLIALWRWPKIGYSLLALFLCASCLSNFFITYQFDLVNGIITFLNLGITEMISAQEQFTDYFTKLYIKPYTRISPYLVGMITGYALFKRKNTNAPRHSLLFLVIGWLIASSVTLETVYGLYHTDPDLIARSFYNAVSRACYGAGLSWVIYVCLVGQGGFINSLLSFKLFIPLSRLTYAAYLIHPMIISWYFQTQRTSMEFTHKNIVILFLGFMLATYALSLPVALILESPIVALEKLVRKKFTSEQKTGTVN